MTHPMIRGGLALAAGAVLGIAACSSQSAAPPAAEPEPVRVLDIAEGQQSEPFEVNVDGGTDGVQVVHRKVTVAPGAGTGRHCHHGQLFVVVEKGELTHYSATYLGGVHVYRAGDSVVEAARYVHEGVNEGSEDLVLTVTYITPEGKPLQERDLTKCER
ncbi:cupin domain-containing protein [Rhodococcus sp. IEGM 1408]|uniref:cupin domain-containing protein n=1 Tax=Rhodococcus sp. IEGM 1408 TaxID=3082220 RepID=UPI0029558211|nr:cupin domain-containing protein [Rhodococcus sp. IEGM 1408]MDV8003019.1 cupin domain-containing protein [Rhodococcus sp. IEGM 1408]